MQAAGIRAWSEEKEEVNIFPWFILLIFFKLINFSIIAENCPLFSDNIFQIFNLKLIFVDFRIGWPNIFMGNMGRVDEICPWVAKRAVPALVCGFHRPTVLEGSIVAQLPVARQKTAVRR